MLAISLPKNYVTQKCIPLVSFWTISNKSPALMDSSLSRWPLKSYNTLAMIFAFAGGLAGGGGGGARFTPPPMLF
jgi:hypothetical protein